MAGIKIVDLPNTALPYTGTERIPITQDGQTRNGTLNSFANYISAFTPPEPPLTQNQIETAITNNSTFLTNIGAVSGNGAGVTSTGAFRDAIGMSAQVVALSPTVSSDTDLSLAGGTVGADQTTAIQAVLDLALAGPLVVLWDVAATAKGLRVHPDTRIVCSAGCGAKLVNDADNALLSNNNYDAAADQVNWETDPDFDVITKDANIQIIGGIWHGNGAEQTHDSVAEGWHVCLRFFNVSNLLLDYVTVYAPRTFSVHLCNTTHTTIRDCLIDCGASEIVNRDGLHFNGPNSHVLVKNLTARTWDDSIGINADDLEEQLSPVAPTVFGPFSNYGPITDFVVDGLHRIGGRYAVRILSGLSRIDRVTIRNVTGEHEGHLLLIDNYSEAPSVLRNAGPGNFGKIVWDGSNTNAIEPSAYKQAAVFVAGDIEHLTLRNMVLSYDETGTSVAPIRFGTTGAGTSCVIDEVSIENFKLLGPTGDEATALDKTISVQGGAAITRMSVVNTIVRRRSTKTQPVGALVAASGIAVISNLLIDGVDAVFVAGNANLANTATITNLDVRNSNIFEVVRGNSLTRLVTRDARMPGTYYLSSSAAEGGVNGMYGGGAMVETDTVFSVVAKLPATLSDSANVSIGSRAIDWRIGASNIDGYLVVIGATSVILGEITTGFAFTANVTRTVTLTPSAEYRMELSCVGTTISGFVQRISDGLWLNTSAAWQTDKVAFGTVTDATYTGKWSYVSIYGGAAGATRTARFRDIQHRPA